jgi:hypothetical protein
MSVDGGPDIIKDGLVLCLDAGNRNSYNSGSTTWFDLSTNRYTGSLVNGTGYSSVNNGVLSFDGTNDYISFGSTTVGSFNNSIFSFGAWFYFNGVSQDKAIMGKRNDAPYNQYNMAISNDAQTGGNGTKCAVFLNPDGNSNSALYTAFNYNLPAAGWYHAMCVVNSTTQQLYVNGALVLSGTKNYAGLTFNITGDPLYVAAINSLDAPAGFFSSNIASVFLYSKALSATEVLQNYNTTKGRFRL